MRRESRRNGKAPSEDGALLVPGEKLCVTVVALATALALLAASPEPQPTNPFNLNPVSPLPVIGTTRSRSLCTALRRSVLPALDASKKNEATFVAGRGLIYQYTIQNEGPGKDFKLFQLDQKTITAMEANRTAFDRFLADPALVPRGARNPGDAALLERLQGQIRGLREAQEREINALSGFLETERMSRYRKRSETEEAMRSAVGAGSAPTIAGDEKVMRDYAIYFNDPRGSISLANARAIDDDLAAIQRVATIGSDALRQTADKTLKECTR